MSNAWNITEAEYQKALELSRDSSTPRDDAAAYWQLCRFYRGQIFIRDDAAHAARLIRGVKDPDDEAAARHAAALGSVLGEG